MTYPDGRVLTYDYGTSGGMNDKLSRVESLGFDGTGNLVQPSYLGLGTQVSTSYNEPNVRWDLITGSSPNPYTGLDRFGRVLDNKWTNYNTATTLDQIKYTYDRASKRTSRENVVAKAQTTPKYFDERYGYDGSNRLSLMERGQLAGSPPLELPTSSSRKTGVSFRRAIGRSSKKMPPVPARGRSIKHAHRTCQ